MGFRQRPAISDCGRYDIIGVPVYGYLALSVDASSYSEHTSVEKAKLSAESHRASGK